LEKAVCLGMFFWQRGALLVPLSLLHHHIHTGRHISCTPWTSGYCSVISLYLLSGKIMAWCNSFLQDL